MTEWRQLTRVGLLSFYEDAVIEENAYGGSRSDGQRTAAERLAEAREEVLRRLAAAVAWSTMTNGAEHKTVWWQLTVEQAQDVVDVLRSAWPEDRGVDEMQAAIDRVVKRWAAWEAEESGSPGLDDWRDEK